MSQPEAVQETPKPQPAPSRIFYPLLFALFPVLSVYSANLALIPFRMMLRPLLIVAVAAFLIWALAALIFRSWQRGAVATSVFIGCSFSYGQFLRLFNSMDIPEFMWNGFWVGSVALLILLIVWKWKWHKLLNFMSAALVISAGGQILYGFANVVKRSQKQPIATAKTTVKERPDIIYIVLDGYGRSDALKRAMGFSNDSFIQGLESRGFFVAKDSRSNYCQTELSVASSLNMDYIQNLVPAEAVKIGDRRSLKELVDESAVVSYLHERGYVFAAITGNFPSLEFETADINLHSISGFSLIETALIQMTPLRSGFYIANTMFAQRRDWIASSFETLGTLGVKSSLPRFVMVHILAPHPPFAFGPNGEHLAPQPPFGYWDGSDYLDFVGSPEDYRKGYSGQAEYIGKRVLQAVDAILGASGPKPVIMIQGDHGSKLRLDQATLDRTDVNECFPNLAAYYAPEPVREHLYDGITPVNSFRTVFNGLFGEKLPMLEDKSWYSPFPVPFQFTEVTQRIANHQEMASVEVPVFPPRPNPNK